MLKGAAFERGIATGPGDGAGGTRRVIRGQDRPLACGPLPRGPLPHDPLRRRADLPLDRYGRRTALDAVRRRGGVVDGGGGAWEHSPSRSRRVGRRVEVRKLGKLGKHFRNREEGHLYLMLGAEGQPQALRSRAVLMNQRTCAAA